MGMDLDDSVHNAVDIVVSDPSVPLNLPENTPVCSKCSVSVAADKSYSCTQCEETFCKIHLENGEGETCAECGKSYCETCIDGVAKCHSCQEGCSVFVCCDLQEMPCGALEHGDCSYYHHKRCRCEKEQYERRDARHTYGYATDSENEDGSAEY